jgi:hypothetical protein
VLRQRRFPYELRDNADAVTALLVAVGLVAFAPEQAPSGAIRGSVTDRSGAVLAGARVIVVRLSTAQVREVITSRDGVYAVPALPPGRYRVTVRLTGFRPSEQLAEVEAGTTTSADVALEVGNVSQTVRVRAVTPVLRFDHHQVAGVIRRDQIDNLPLNGRNFLDLARLEPGVSNPVRGANNRTFVAALGAGRQFVPRVGFTQVTVDGASINALHTFGASLQVSQEAVQEFQMSTAGFDLSTGATTNGAINVVTRSGGNASGGAVFAFFRDHRLSAYPALRPDPANPDPFFRRVQAGAAFGGPIRKDHLFFFGGFERHRQDAVVALQPTEPEFAALGGIFPSPYDGRLFTLRVDGRLGANQSAFVRYTHDGSWEFAPLNPAARVLPSGWQQASNHVNQGVVGLTSVLSATLVNDLRVAYFSLRTAERPPELEHCPGCFGLGGPRIVIQGSGLTLGRFRILDASGHRVQVIDHMIRQMRRHVLRFGFELERTVSTVAQIDRDPAVITVWSPAEVRRRNPAIPLPAAFVTIDDILRLPLRNFETAVGPATVPERGFSPNRVTDLYRVHASDTWQPHSRLTMNGGLSWFVEPEALNHDLDKPALLAPILGIEGLRAPRVRYANVGAAGGLVWAATRDRRTVIRGGIGRYFDPLSSTNLTNLSLERAQLLPVGTTRVIIPGSSASCGGIIPDFTAQPTSFTAAHLLSCLPEIWAAHAGVLNPANRDFAVRTIDVTKNGRNLSDPANRATSAVHVTVGTQRELAAGFVVSADIVWKRFFNTIVNGIDYNRWNAATGPVIRRCLGAESKDVSAVCSTGPMYFDTTSGRARYLGVLARVDWRRGTTAQLTASYALGSYTGSNATGTATAENAGGRVFGFNNDDWFENVGPMPTDTRHLLNASGLFRLPWELHVGFSVSASSAVPFTAYVSGFDFNGDGTTNDLLPGTRVNQFGRGLDKSDLERLVARYNDEVAGRPLCCGQNVPPPLVLPAEYAFDDPFFTQDLRVSRSFPLGGRVRLTLSADIFNLLNTANSTGFSGNLADRTVFGQPTGLVSQVFGSGGPRAVQLAARVAF